MLFIEAIQILTKIIDLYIDKVKINKIKAIDKIKAFNNFQDKDIHWNDLNIIMINYLSNSLIIV